MVTSLMCVGAASENVQGRKLYVVLLPGGKETKSMRNIQNPSGNERVDHSIERDFRLGVDAGLD